MIDDKELDSLLSAYKPEIQGEKDFMRMLSQKMDAVDMVMQYKAREVKANQRRATVCFASGVVVGVLFVLVSLLLPSPIEMIQLSIHSYLLDFLLGNLHYLALAICLGLSLYGVIGILRARDMRQELREAHVLR
ncbi:MAG: hypothetical protein ACI4UA_04445 [Bacteroidaceae bacterium]